MKKEEKKKSSFFLKLFLIPYTTWFVISLITMLVPEETEADHIALGELIFTDVVILFGWFAISFVIALIINEVKKSKPKTKIVKEVQYIIKPDDKLTIKPEEMKEEIKKELKEEMKKEAKKKVNDECLFSCESIVDGYEYKKMARYFPKRMYWVFVIRGTIFNIIITALIAIFTQSWIATLIFLLAYELYLLIYYKLRLEPMAEKVHNARLKRGETGVNFETEFYEDYFIRKGEKNSVTIDYSEITRCVENDTNFYLEYAKMNIVFIFQKNDMDNELINFIRNKFENIDNKLGDKIKFKTQEEIKNPESIEKILTVLFVITLLCIYGANFAITKVLEINNTDDALKYVWITWLFLPVPITSIILGYKYKKRGIRCTKNIVAGIIVGTLLLIYGLFYVIPFDDIIPKFDDTIMVIKNKKGDSNKFNKTLVRDERVIYMADNISEVYYTYEKITYKLNDYIIGMWQTTDDGIKHLTDQLENTDILKDGGTKIYKSSKYNITIITCNTIEGNKDIFIGDYNMKFDSNTMCR